MKNKSKFIHINSRVLNLVKQAIRAAIAYENMTGRKLGITGEVGEVLVCKSLGLALLLDQISPGIDAVDPKNGEKYQIKTRRGDTASPGARIGTFSKHKFDYAVLAILNEKYELVELYKTTAKKIEPILQRHKKRNPPLRQFKRVARPAMV